MSAKLHSLLSERVFIKDWNNLIIGRQGGLAISASFTPVLYLNSKWLPKIQFICNPPNIFLFTYYTYFWGMKNNKLDLTRWITQQAYADELNVNVQNIHNWVRRGKIDWQFLPGSRIKLVDKTSLNINENHYKRKS